MDNKEQITKLNEEKKGVLENVKFQEERIDSAKTAIHWAKKRLKLIDEELKYLGQKGVAE